MALQRAVACLVILNSWSICSQHSVGYEFLLIMGGTFPIVGEAFPAVGGAFPEMGGVFPEVGEAIPALGGAFPEVGGVFPEVGEAIPALGGAFPEVGGVFPEVGETIPAVGCETYIWVSCCTPKTSTCGEEHAIDPYAGCQTHHCFIQAN